MLFFLTTNPLTSMGQEDEVIGGMRANVRGYVIFNCARNIDWPVNNEPKDTFWVGFLGSDTTTIQMLTAFKFAEKFRRLKKLPIRAKHFSSLDEYMPVNVLYANDNNEFSLEQIYQTIGTTSVLLTTEGFPFEKTMINLVQVHKFERYEINLTNMRKAHLEPNNFLIKMSSKSEENFTDASEILTLIEKDEDVELNARDIKILLDEYNRKIEQIDLQTIEIAEQSRELQNLLAEIEAQQLELKQRGMVLKQKEMLITHSKQELSVLSNKNLAQNLKLQATKNALLKEMAGLDSLHVKMREEKANFELQQQTFGDLIDKQDSVLMAKKNEIKLSQDKIANQQNSITNKNAELKEKNWLLTAGIFMMIALFGVVALIYINYRNKKKSHRILEIKNAIIEDQKSQVEEKNRELLDSITYAKRIQLAILPTDKLVKSYLKESFVLYKPKDIVAGDFYWMEHLNDKVLFAAADCTGHGVPGAMVSVICNNALNKAVREYQVCDPGLILDKAREIVIQEFEKSSEEVKDGMDIAICSLDVKTKELKFAGAQNPIWVVRKDNKQQESLAAHTDGKEPKSDFGFVLHEIKGNKQPIGKFDDVKPFTTHTIQIEKGDALYIFSDGFADQFGGLHGKKLKAKNMKTLILEMQHLELSEQRKFLDHKFEAWRGQLEQLDDVCVLGVRV